MLKNSMFFIVFSFIAAGCASSTVGPGAGAAQGIVKGSVDDVNHRAQTVFQQMNIQVTGNSTKNSGNERQLLGKIGDTDVTVTMDNAPNSTTSVEVDASKNIVNGDRELAKEILSRIIQQG